MCGQRTMKSFPEVTSLERKDFMKPTVRLRKRFAYSSLFIMNVNTLENFTRQVILHLKYLFIYYYFVTFPPILSKPLISQTISCI